MDGPHMIVIIFMTISYMIAIIFMTISYMIAIFFKKGIKYNCNLSNEEDYLERLKSYLVILVRVCSYFWLWLHSY